MTSKDIVAASDDGSFSPQKEVDYFLCYAKSGKAHDIAIKAKEWFLNQGLSIWDRYSYEQHATPPPLSGDLERHKLCVNACRIFVSKAVLLFVDFEWLSSSQCLFDYDLAQLQNLTSSRPVIFPIFCEDLSCCSDIGINALVNGIKLNLPPIETWNQPSGVTLEDIFHHINYKLGSILLKHFPNLPKLPEYAAQESRRASRASSIMTLLSSPTPVEQLPSGKWVGVILGHGRHRIGGKFHAGGSGRYPMDCLLRMRPRAGAAGAAADANAFHGHGRDDVGLFMINGSRKGANVEFEQTYSDLEKSRQCPYTIRFQGLCHGVALSGRWTIQDEDTEESGYWALWPERPEENRHWEHYVLYFKNRQSETSSSSSLSFASPRPKITDSSIIGGSSSSSGSAIGGSSSSSGSSGVRSASISNLVTSEKASSSSSAALSGISASQPSAGRITERVSTTTKTESGVTSGLNKAAKTTSAESLDAQTKKVHFAEEQPQQQQQQQRPPATPSFGVRLSFNTEKLIGGGGVGAGSGTPTLSQPKSLMTASMPNVADITATILTSEELENLNPTGPSGEFSNSTSSSMTSSMIEMSSSTTSQNDLSSNTRQPQPQQTTATTEKTTTTTQKATPILVQHAPTSKTMTSSSPQLATPPHAATATVPKPPTPTPPATPQPPTPTPPTTPQPPTPTPPSPTPPSLTTKPPSPPFKLTSPKPNVVVVDVQKRDSSSSFSSSSSLTASNAGATPTERVIPIERDKSPRSSSSSIERMIPIEREKSPRLRLKERSPIVIVQEKSALESSPTEAPLVIREETTSFLAKKRDASPIRIVREEDQVSTKIVDGKLSAANAVITATPATTTTAEAPKSPRITEIPVVPLFDAPEARVTPVAAAPAAAAAPTTPPLAAAADSDFYQQIASSLPATAAATFQEVTAQTTTPVSPVVAIPVLQEMTISSKEESENGGAASAGGGAKRKRNRKKRKSASQNEEMTTTTTTVIESSSSRDGNVPIPVLREGGSGKSNKASADGVVDVPVVKTVTNTVVHTSSSSSGGGGDGSGVGGAIEIPVVQTTESSSRSAVTSFGGGGGGGGRGSFGAGRGGLFGDGDEFFSGSLLDGMPALHGMPPLPARMMNAFQGPDVTTTRHHHSDSMNFVDSKDGVQGNVAAETQSTQMSSTNQSVDPITGQSTSSSFFSTSYSSSSSTNNVTGGDGANMIGGGMTAGAGDFFFRNAPSAEATCNPPDIVTPTCSCSVSSGRVFLFELIDNKHNHSDLSGMMSALSLTIPPEDGVTVPIVHSPASLVSTEDTKTTFSDSGPIVSEIIE